MYVLHHKDSLRNSSTRLFATPVLLRLLNRNKSNELRVVTQQVNKLGRSSWAETHLVYAEADYVISIGEEKKKKRIKVSDRVVRLGQFLFFLFFVEATIRSEKLGNSWTPPMQCWFELVSQMLSPLMAFCSFLKTCRDETFLYATGFY